MHRQLERAVINTVQVVWLEESIGRVERACGRKLHGPNEIPGAGLHAYWADPTGILFGLLEPVAGS